jgi:hypothetical protein
MSVEGFGESVARVIDRRKFLSRAAIALAGAVAALAAEGTLSPSWAVSVNGPCPNPTRAGHCNPPNGVYCTPRSEKCTSDGGCQSPACTFLTTSYSTGCWCTKQVCLNCGSGCATCGGCTECHHYVCCDCKCGSERCGCRKRIVDCSCSAAAA